MKIRTHENCKFKVIITLQVIKSTRNKLSYFDLINSIYTKIMRIKQITTRLFLFNCSHPSTMNVYICDVFMQSFLIVIQRVS